MTTFSNNFQVISDAWKFVLPPSRPSELELQRIRAFLTTIDRKAHVAVLGSTVEYRDLLKELCFKFIYIFDKNRTFYTLSEQWCAYDTSEEVFIEGDWLTTLSDYRNQFKVVLSDLTMGNINYTQRADFYRLISQSVTLNGFFVDKVLTNELPYIPLNYLQEKYLQMPLNFQTANHFSCEALFCSELLHDGEINTTEFYSILRKKFSLFPKLLKLIEMSHMITPEGCIWYYGKEWHTLENDYMSFYADSPFFMDSLNSPYYGRLRHFFHKKG